jgi:hypothetical protein
VPKRVGLIKDYTIVYVAWALFGWVKEKKIGPVCCTRLRITTDFHAWSFHVLSVTSPTVATSDSPYFMSPINLLCRKKFLFAKFLHSHKHPTVALAIEWIATEQPPKEKNIWHSDEINQVCYVDIWISVLHILPAAGFAHVLTKLRFELRRHDQHTI